MTECDCSPYFSACPKCNLQLDFEEGDLIIEFYGKRYDDWHDTYDNCKYAVEIKTYRAVAAG